MTGCCRELITPNERAYLDPRSIISKDSCLIMTSDASDTAVAVSLFRVLKPDATMVTPEDLRNPALSRLVGVAYKKLDDNKLKWHTFETGL